MPRHRQNLPRRRPVVGLARQCRVDRRQAHLGHERSGWFKYRHRRHSYDSDRPIGPARDVSGTVGELARALTPPSEDVRALTIAMDAMNPRFIGVDDARGALRRERDLIPGKRGWRRGARSQGNHDRIGRGRGVTGNSDESDGCQRRRSLEQAGRAARARRSGPGQFPMAPRTGSAPLRQSESRHGELRDRAPGAGPGDGVGPAVSGFLTRHGRPGAPYTDHAGHFGQWLSKKEARTDTITARDP